MFDKLFHTLHVKWRKATMDRQAQLIEVMVDYSIPFQILVEQQSGEFVSEVIETGFLDSLKDYFPDEPEEFYTEAVKMCYDNAKAMAEAKGETV